MRVWIDETEACRARRPSCCLGGAIIRALNVTEFQIGYSGRNNRGGS